MPEKGKVNENLIAFLARILKIPKSDIHILTGETSHLKKLNIQGMSLDTVKAIVSEKE